MNKLNMGLDCLAQRKVDEAQRIFTEVINEYPSKIDGYYCMALLKSQHLKDYQGAIFYFKKGLVVAPFFEAYKGLAENYLLLGDLNNALPYLKQALIYKSDSPECQLYLNRYFPKEAKYLNNTPVVINGICEKSKLCPNIEYSKVYDAGMIERKEPKYIEEFLTENQKRVLFASIEKLKKMNYDEGFVIKIPKGKVFLKQSEQTHILTSNNELLGDIFNHSQTPFGKMPNSLNVAENLLVLSTCYSGNFYHWLTWTIPKLYMAEKAGYTLKYFDKIAINYTGLNFQKEIFSHLNIPMNKIIGTIPNGVVLEADKLVATSIPKSGITPPVVIESLRNKFLSPQIYDKNSPSKIYLSRNKSAARHVLNETDVVDFLEKEGFVVIYAEEHSFLDQVKLFANADFIISQHGAGLVNLSFCSPNTKVIEIHNEEELWKQKRLPDGSFTRNKASDNAFMRISADNNLNYQVMYGDVLGLDMNVDMYKFKATYELALS